MKNKAPKGYRSILLRRLRNLVPAPVKRNTPSLRLLIETDGRNNGYLI